MAMAREAAARRLLLLIGELPDFHLCDKTSTPVADQLIRVHLPTFGIHAYAPPTLETVDKCFAHGPSTAFTNHPPVRLSDLFSLHPGPPVIRISPPPVAFATCRIDLPTGP